MDNLEIGSWKLDESLALALGYKEITTNPKFLSKFEAVNSATGMTEVVQRWTRDDGAAFRLLVDLDLNIEFFPSGFKSEGIYTQYPFTIYRRTELPYGFHTKADLVKTFIVKAAINKLTKAKE